MQHHPRGSRDQMLDLYGLPASPPESTTPRPAPADLSSHRCDGVCGDGERRRMPPPSPLLTWGLGAVAAVLLGSVAVLGVIVDSAGEGSCSATEAAVCGQQAER